MNASKDLLITVERKDGDRSLRFTDMLSCEDELVPLTPRVLGAIAEWRAGLPSSLAPFHQAVGNLQQCREEERWPLINKAVEKLRDIGLNLLHNLTGSGRRADRLQTFLARAIPLSWEAREQPARVQLLVEDRDQDLLSLPIEYLPLGFVLPHRTIQHPTDLQEALSIYAGFAAIVVHRLDQGSTSHNILEAKANGAIPVKVISNDEFYFNKPTFRAASEAIWLSEQRSKCDVEPLWPDDKTSPDHAGDALAKCLFDPRHALRSLGEPRASHSDQIQHISCHFTPNPERLALRNKRPPVDEIRIELSTLQSKITGMRHAPSAAQLPGPFIFLNACRSGAIDPRKLASLVETLLCFTPVRALLTAETEIEFVLAAAFARCVYAEIFRGRSLGEAVHWARWELVRRDDNPFGILYTLYGDPTLHLTRGRQTAAGGSATVAASRGFYA